ncbi:MAG: hypothetical protein RL095_1931 [Verrucomicrobiota bacterium]|jgi:hypothetical protein
MDLLAEISRGCRLRCAILTEPGPAGRLKTSRFLLDGVEQAGFSYDPAHAPCANVLSYGAFLIPNGVQVLFPDDPGLKKVAAQCYLGIRRSNGGHLCLLDPQPWSPERLDTPELPNLLGREFTDTLLFLQALVRKLD